MTRTLFGLMLLLAASGCAAPAPGTHPREAVNDDPSLKPPVTITTLQGNQFTCQAGPGAYCVQR